MRDSVRKEQGVFRFRSSRLAGSKVSQRERILRALREFLEEGDLGHCTMQAIATRCKISKRTIYAVFSSKEELFDALLQDMLEQCLPVRGIRAEGWDILLDDLVAICTVLSSGESLGVFVCVATEIGARATFRLWLETRLRKFLEDRLDCTIRQISHESFLDDETIRVMRTRTLGALVGLFSADISLSWSGTASAANLKRSDLRKIVEIILTASMRAP